MLHANCEPVTMALVMAVCRLQVCGSFFKCINFVSFTHLYPGGFSVEHGLNAMNNAYCGQVEMEAERFDILRRVRLAKLPSTQHCQIAREVTRATPHGPSQ